MCHAVARWEVYILSDFNLIGHYLTNFNPAQCPTCLKATIQLKRVELLRTVLEISKSNLKPSSSLKLILKKWIYLFEITVDWIIYWYVYSSGGFVFFVVAPAFLFCLYAWLHMFSCQRLTFFTGKPNTNLVPVSHNRPRRNAGNSGRFSKGTGCINWKLMWVCWTPWRII